MRLSSSSLEMASARISCSVRSAKRFTAQFLFRITINKESVQTTGRDKKSGRRRQNQSAAGKTTTPQAGPGRRKRGGMQCWRAGAPRWRGQKAPLAFLYNHLFVIRASGAATKGALQVTAGPPAEALLVL